MIPVDTFTVGTNKVEIYPDDNVENPRKGGGEFGHMLCWHRRYALGDDKGEFRSQELGTDLFLQWYNKHLRDVVLLPLFLYDHSGLTMRTNDFRDIDPQGWDSGQVGWIYASRADIREWFGKKKVTKKLLARALEVLEDAVKVYDEYLRGEVYYYVVENERGEIVDSQGGIWGLNEAKELAKEAAAG